MAEKAKPGAPVQKGPPTKMVMHNGVPTVANRCNKGYRCTKCKSETHEPVPDQRKS
jgi:hypothetical protein